MAKKILKLNLGDIIKITGNKKLKKLSVLLNLIAPHIDITDDILNVYDDEGLATSYDILVDGVVKATLTRLARPEIGIEETYIKGAAIEGAKSYKLFKVADDQYTDIGEQVIGKQNEGFTKGYVDSTGAFVNDENIGWKRTDFIHIDQLADIGGACVMLTPDTTSSTNYSVANFYTDNDASTFVGSLSYNDMNSVGFKAADVAYYAQTKNAKYVVFASRWQSAESLWANLTDAIFFCLDEYADILTAGESHTLVVQAIGDGDSYEDSDYSNNALYVVEEEVVKTYTLHVGGTGATSFISYYTPDKNPEDNDGVWTDYDPGDQDISNIKNFVFLRHYFYYNASASTFTNCTGEQVGSYVKITITGDNPSCSIWVDD